MITADRFSYANQKRLQDSPKIAFRGYKEIASELKSAMMAKVDSFVDASEGDMYMHGLHQRNAENSIESATKDAEFSKFLLNGENEVVTDFPEKTRRRLMYQMDHLQRFYQEANAVVEGFNSFATSFCEQAAKNSDAPKEQVIEFLKKVAPIINSNQKDVAVNSGFEIAKQLYR